MIKLENAPPKEKTRIWSLALPAILLAFSLAYLIWASVTGNFLYDVDLAGGTQVSFVTAAQPDSAALEQALAIYHPVVRTARGLSGWTVGVDVDAATNTSALLSTLGAAGWPVEKASIQSVGPALGAAFFNQAKIAFVAAFIFMAFAVFLTFRNPFPSGYVVLCAFADVLEALAFSQLLGIRLSLATFAALLLLIGYSVDTDILLTARVLKGEGNINELIRRARRTGLTMTGTTTAALFALFAMSGSAVITQIAAVLLLGMLFDVINTWITNAKLLTWYVERRAKI